MYRLMISPGRENFKSPDLFGSKEFLLPNAEEVCKVITALSHLDPIITLSKINVSSSEDVLKYYEIKEILF